MVEHIINYEHYNEYLTRSTGITYCRLSGSNFFIFNNFACRHSVQISFEMLILIRYGN